MWTKLPLSPIRNNSPFRGTAKLYIQQPFHLDLQEQFILHPFQDGKVLVQTSWDSPHVEQALTGTC